jgi:uncharacterized protein YkwD
MNTKCMLGGLLAALLLATIPAFAQKTKEHTTPTQTNKASTANTRSEPNLERVTQLIVRLTNQFRRQEGRRELQVNPKLERAARYFADYLARTDECSHTADGKEPWERAERFGYEYAIVAENIAWEYSSAGFTTRRLAEKFIDGWKKSPHHRKNMLDPDVDEIGVGVARSKKTGRYYAVQDFGRPRSEEITFEISNQTDTTVRYKVDGKEHTLRPGYIATHRTPRPSQLNFLFEGEKSDKAKVYRPEINEHFTIRKGSGDRLIVEED